MLLPIKVSLEKLGFFSLREKISYVDRIDRTSDSLSWPSQCIVRNRKIRRTWRSRQWRPDRGRSEEQLQKRSNRTLIFNKRD